MNSLIVFLTVPHRTCPKTPNPECDLLAENAARALAGALHARKIQVELFLGDMPRTTVDLNRVASRTTPFRNRLRERLKIQQQRVILLDIHSFPEIETTNLDTYIIYQSQRRFFILPGLSVNAPQLYVSSLISYWKQRKIKTKAILGQFNDIIEEAVNMNVPAMLLEFSNNLSQERLDFIAQTTADWVLTQL